MRRHALMEARTCVGADPRNPSARNLLYQRPVTKALIFPKDSNNQALRRLAERERFEPPIGLHLCRISSAVYSTTLPPLLKTPSKELRPLWLGALIGEHGGPDKARGTKIGPVFGTGAAEALVSGVARMAKDWSWQLRSSNDWECNRALAHVRVWTFFKPVLLSASGPFTSLCQEDPGMRDLHPSFVNPR